MARAKNLKLGVRFSDCFVLCFPHTENAPEKYQWWCSAQTVGTVEHERKVPQGIQAFCPVTYILIVLTSVRSYERDFMEAEHAEMRVCEEMSSQQPNG